MGASGFGVGRAGSVVAHLPEPFGKAQKLATLTDKESPEIAQTDLIGVETGVRFETPAEVWAAPGAKAVSAGGGPEKMKGFEHWRRRSLRCHCKAAARPRGWCGGRRCSLTAGQLAL